MKRRERGKGREKGSKEEDLFASSNHVVPAPERSFSGQTLGSKEYLLLRGSPTVRPCLTFMATP